MTERRFLYDEGLLEACAKSIGEEHASELPPDRFDESCQTLFSQYSKHFYGDGHFLRSRGGGLSVFVRNVRFVHEHNTAKDATYSVALNRFADSHLLWSEDADENHRQLRKSSHHHGSHKHHKDDDSVYESLDLPGLDADNPLAQYHGILDGVLVKELSDPKVIMEVAANLAVGKGGKGHLNKYKPSIHTGKHKNKLYDILQDRSVDVPLANQEEFQAPEGTFSESNEGGLLSIKRNPEYDRQNDPDAKNLDVHDASHAKDDFSTYLNWATADNPDGVPIVHDSFDQVGIVCMIFARESLHLIS